MRYDLVGKRVRTDKGWGTVKDVDCDVAPLPSYLTYDEG